MDLMLYGAVPFNYPEGSIAERRRRKNGGTPPTADQLMMMQVATEAAEAIQFVLGPRHRSLSTGTSASPSYMNPENKYRGPPNTPATSKQTGHFSFDNTENDADCSESDDSASNDYNVKAAKEPKKRRRLCSFSDSAPNTRRVPNKKITNEDAARKIVQSSTSRKNKTAKEVTRKSPGNLDTPDCHAVSKLCFFSEVQKIVDEKHNNLPEEKWKHLGKSLRQIADKFGGSQGLPKGVGSDILPNGVWAAVFSYVFWKFIRGFK